jgi:hypothetical protein
MILTAVVAFRASSRRCGAASPKQTLEKVRSILIGWRSVQRDKVNFRSGWIEFYYTAIDVFLVKMT